MTNPKQSPAAARLLALCLVALAAITASADNAESTKGAPANAAPVVNTAPLANVANVANIANIVNAANIAPLVNNGGGFSAFFRAGQLRMLSAFDDALSAQAADMIMRQLPAVQSAGVDIQTKLGGRPGHLGVNVIGAFADDDSRAFGWQLRGYAAQGNNPGLNAGLFYRRIESGEVMLGVNTFADYEKDDTGEYLRYSFGAEVVHRTFTFGANYYTPITGDKDMTGGTVAFSRKGYDAKLRVNIPRVDNLKAGADYYNFGGRHNADDEKGYRYGLELQPTPSWQLALFYDDGNKKLGGGISYSRTIGEVKNSAAAGIAGIDSAALFAPVWREHSQRITTAKPRPALLPLLNDLNLRLFDAAQQGLTASIIALLAQGADVNAANAFGSTPLHQAAFNGQNDAARLLISLGAGINRRQNFGGWAPLHFAASQGRLPMITILIAANANLNLQDAQGGTPLHNAVFNGWHLAASALVSAGANINSRANDGATPLHFAARQSRSAAAARILVSATGVNVNAKDNAGWTPLHDAADQGNADIAAILIAARASVNAIDNANTTPLDLAIDRGHSAVADILRAANGLCNLLLPEHGTGCPVGSITPRPVSLDIFVVDILPTGMTTAARTITTTMATGGMVTTTTRTTMAAMTTTTTTTMTITPQVIMSMTTTTPGMTTTMTMTNTPPPRLASVRATTRHLFTAQAGVRNYLVETQTPYPVTLPAPGTNRPWVVNVSAPGAGFSDGLSGLTVSVIESNANPSTGQTFCCALLLNSRTYSFTIVQGSETLVPTTTVTTTTTIMGTEMRTTTTTDAVLDISVEMMTTGAVITETTMTIGGMTTFTTMTIQPISTTTAITIYATATITLRTNSAMGELPFDDGNGITNPPPIINPSFSVDSAGISFLVGRFPRLRRENDDEGGGNDNNITNPPPIIAATKPTPLSPPIFSSFPPNSPSFLRRLESIAAKRRIIMPRPVGRG